MFNSGYISFFTETAAGGQDADGNPLKATKVESGNIPCNLAVVQKEYKVFVDGEYRFAKYSLYIDTPKIPTSVDITLVKEVRVTDVKMVDLGVFRVGNLEHLALMDQTKIVV